MSLEIRTDIAYGSHEYRSIRAEFQSLDVEGTQQTGCWARAACKSSFESSQEKYNSVWAFSDRKRELDSVEGGIVSSRILDYCSNLDDVETQEREAQSSTAAAQNQRISDSEKFDIFS